MLFFFCIFKTKFFIYFFYFFGVGATGWTVWLGEPYTLKKTVRNFAQT